MSSTATIVVVPLLAVTCSLIPAPYLALLNVIQTRYAEAEFEGPVPPLASLLKALGAVSLFTGHYVIASGKPRFELADACYFGGVIALFALFGGGCAKAAGYAASAPGVEAAGAGGALLGACFLKMASSAGGARPLIKGAIGCGLAGSAALVGVARGVPDAAMAASCCFLAANTAVLVALHAAPARSRLGQLLKVLGSVGLFSGNCLGLGYHGLAPGGVLGDDVGASLRAAPPAHQAAALAAAVAVAYAIAARATTAAPKKKTA